MIISARNSQKEYLINTNLPHLYQILFKDMLQIRSIIVKTQIFGGWDKFPITNSSHSPSTGLKSSIVHTQKMTKFELETGNIFIYGEYFT